jgi:glutamine amidotransferase
MSKFKKIGVINGFGNFKSVKNIFNYLDCDFVEIDNYKELNQVTHIILPGVGSYDNVIAQLKKRELFNALQEQILSFNKYYLGICVGMQILSTLGCENDKVNGFNFIPGETKKIEVKKEKLPNMGWHQIIKKRDSSLFKNIDDSDSFYFLHSYEFRADNIDHITTIINYEEQVVSSIESNNIFGVQFHPEKSQMSGIKIITNFINL